MRSGKGTLLRSVVVAVAAALMLPVLVSAPGPASAAADDRWFLVETRVNPGDEPTEFVVGVTPGYYESPRFDGTFARYTVNGTSISSHRRSVDRGVQNWDITTDVALTAPPAFMLPGEVITLGANGTSSGVAGDWNPFEQFEFRAEGVTLEGDTFFAVGLNPSNVPSSASVNPSFEVPSPSGPDDELRITAGLWNCSACHIEWVFQPELAAPTPVPPVPTSPPTPTPVPTPTEPLQCFIRGRVRDAGARPDGLRDPNGHPLIDVYVALDFDRGTTLVTTDTDEHGEYTLAVSSEVLPAAFDIGRDQVAVELQLIEAAHEPPRFEVHHEGGPAKMFSDRFVLGDACGTDGEVQRDFLLAEIPGDYESVFPWEGEREDWDDIGEIYDRIHRATRLADLLGQTLDYGGLETGDPLIVCAFCTDVEVTPGTGFIEDSDAFWCGRTSSGELCSERPFIGFGDEVSRLSSPDWPDNREYHEFGHHFLADAFGNAFPYFAGDLNHAGYYVNYSTTDSWNEGFAEFFSMMVSKHIDLEPQAQLYRLGDAYDDYEFDWRPWIGEGQAEEMAIAGLLLDLEDGADDYAGGRIPPQLTMAWYDVYSNPVLGSVLVGEVINEAPWYPEYLDYSEQTMVAAEFIQGGASVHTAWAITSPWDIQGDGSRGFFAMVIPADVTWDRVDVVAFEGRPGDLETDDDLVDLELADLWEAIVTHKSVQPQSNGYLFDVADLYEAVSTEFGGNDLDGNGMDDIDQLFVAHGLFSDPDGDHSFHDEDPGGTGHPALGPYPEQIPRRTAVVLPGTRMTVDVGGVDGARVVVQVIPERATPYSYLATPDPAGRVHVAVPPEGEVLLGVVAPGYEPAVAGAVDADELWADVGARGADAAPRFAVDLTLEKEGGGIGVMPIALAIGGVALLAAAAIWFGRA